jgi:hypothetical protein
MSGNERPRTVARTELFRSQNDNEVTTRTVRRVCLKILFRNSPGKAEENQEHLVEIPGTQRLAAFNGCIWFRIRTSGELL